MENKNQNPEQTAKTQQPGENTTQMTNPPQNNTNMVAPKKKVLIEALRVIRVNGQEVAPGQQVQCSEEEAADFCKPYKLNYAFGGERSVNDSPRHEIVRAKRVG